MPLPATAKTRSEHGAEGGHARIATSAARVAECHILLMRIRSNLEAQALSHLSQMKQRQIAPIH